MIPGSGITTRDFDERLWTYRARYIRTKDADTIVVSVDLGFSARYEMSLRLADYNAPENDTPEGAVATERMRRIFAGDTYTGAMLEARYWPLRVVTRQLPRGGETRSFERYVGDVYLVGEDGELTDIKDLLTND